MVAGKAEPAVRVRRALSSTSTAMLKQFILEVFVVFDLQNVAREENRRRLDVRNIKLVLMTESFSSTQSRALSNIVTSKSPCDQSRMFHSG